MEPGDTIGRYRLDALLGEGAMAQVFAATHPHRERKLAVKILKPEAQRDAEYVQRFFAEVKAADALDHPNIVRVHDVDEADGVPFIVMELIDGEPLDRLIADGGQLDVEQATRLVREIASALAAAHAIGTVHRDVKPSNIVVDKLTLRAKLTDFGAAKRIAGDGLVETMHGQLTGTPRYMAPEQYGHGEVDGRSDLFSLGATFYEMLAGRPAFPGDNIGTVAYAIVHGSPTPIDELRPDVPAHVRRLLDRMLSKAPADRPADGAEVVAALTPHLGDTQRFSTPIIEPPAPPVAEPPGPEPKPVRPGGVLTPAPPEQRARRLQPILAVAATMVVVAGGIGYLLLSPETPPPAVERPTGQAPPGPPPDDLAEERPPAPPDAQVPAPGPPDTVQPEPPRPVCQEEPPDPGCAVARRVVERIRSAAPGPAIRPNRADGVYGDGDHVVVEATMPAGGDGFLYVDVLTADGMVFHLLPEPMRADNALPAGGTIRLGVEAAEERPGVRVWRAGAPFGPAYIVAVSSDRSLLEVPSGPMASLVDYERSIAAALDATPGADRRISVLRLEFRPRG